ncbi:MAG TPA: GtrA family protein [Solirubrobacterales bacterium]|jgi:putative flippase GtrA
MNTALAVRLGAVARQPDNWIQLAKFALVGGSGYVINLGVFTVLGNDLGIGHQVAAVAAFAVAVVNNFLWNRYWTFRSGAGSAGFQAAQFFAVSIASLGLNLAVLELIWRAGVVGPIAAQAIAVAVATPLNFLGNKLWTFA